MSQKPVDKQAKQAEYKAKQESALQKIKNSTDYKKFNKTDSPKSCDILETWFVTLGEDTGLNDISEKIGGQTKWLAEVRDQRLGFGLQNMMAGLFLDPISDTIISFQKKVKLLNSEIAKLQEINMELRTNSELNTSIEERQELRLLTAENEKLITDSQELLAKVQFLEAKESTMAVIKKDIQEQLTNLTNPIVNDINSKINELNEITGKNLC